MERLENQALALAGMFQAAVLIEELANIGSCNDAALDGCYRSLFTFDAATPGEVYGDIACLHTGFDAIQDYLGGRGPSPSRNIAYYVLSMLKLSKALLGDPQRAARLADGLREIERTGADFELSRTGCYQRIDGLYQQYVSGLQPRIIVRGSPSLLQDGDNAARIRTLLLAGIRAAVLWHQLGGSKWRLLWSRKKYVSIARALKASAGVNG